MRFIHTADWQIGMKAAHVGVAGGIVREQRLHSARKVVEVARQSAADFMVLAGDTFEDNAVDRLLVQKVGDILAEFGRPVYLLPGNHDPLVPGSVWDHSVWSSHSNLELLRERSPRVVPGGVLHPCPVYEKHSPSDPTLWIDARSNAEVSVGLAHGTVEGVSQDEPDYPISRNAAGRATLDYLAIGHWHSYATYADENGSTRMAYSGTHETTKFGERDSGNVLLVEIDARGANPRLTRLPTGGLSWQTIEKEARCPGEIEEVRQAIEKIDNAKTTLVDVHLAGVLHPGDEAELARIDEVVASRFLYGRIDHSLLLPRPDDETWLAEVPPGVLPGVAERLQQLADRAYVGVRPEYATSEVAAQALLELYQLVREAKA